jgi:hypothetical protein
MQSRKTFYPVLTRYRIRIDIRPQIFSGGALEF